MDQTRLLRTISKTELDSKVTGSADKATFVYGGNTPISPNQYIRAYLCSRSAIFCELVRVQMEASLSNLSLFPTKQQ